MYVTGWMDCQSKWIQMRHLLLNFRHFLIVLQERLCITGSVFGRML